MKKFIFSVFAIFGMTMTMSAQTLTLPKEGVEAVPGETVKATLNLNCDANTFVGFKFTLQFPSESATKFSIKGLSGVSQPTVGKMNEGKVIFTGINGVDSETADIIYLDGATDLEISIAVAEDLPIGTYPIQVIDFQLDQKGTMVDVAGGTFNINVVNAHTVTLDENSEVDPEPATGVNARVLRTIKGGNWSTICLPFAMTAEQLEKAFGEVPEVKDFTGYVYDEANDAIKVNFSAVTAMEANHPYIIKVSADVTEFVVEGVDIDPDEYPSVSFGSGKGRQYMAMDFIGTYVANFDMFENIGLNSTSPLFLSENKWWFATDATPKLKAFRAFFDFSDFTPSASTRINMSFDEQTGIDNVTYQLDGEFYDLKGQRVETPSKGIFIKGGKKVVVK